MPVMMRLSRSRPSSSVPNGCESDGASSFEPVMSCGIGIVWRERLAENGQQEKQADDDQTDQIQSVPDQKALEVATKLAFGCCSPSACMGGDAAPIAVARVAASMRIGCSSVRQSWVEEEVENVDDHVHEDEDGAITSVVAIVAL